MRDIFRALCAAAILASPAAAAAQGTNSFDGSYRGVSITVEKYGGKVGRCPAPSGPRPATLTIANGIVRGGAFEGTITPQGALRLKTERAFVVEGRIDAQGTRAGPGQRRPLRVELRLGESGLIQPYAPTRRLMKSNTASSAPKRARSSWPASGENQPSLGSGAAAKSA